ncbi:hypothetical protein PIB30_088365 [Stylosanthes scabra]|uniref:Uncharacterized protein n=1 Tax=Stylosanthes scabra TaxID=79078 RepID=A0ABU6TT53_9FABA|nr:hypothetical protein [Stylosanthes scabra]
MKKGSLRSKERSMEAILPRVPRIGVEAGIEVHAYAWIITPSAQQQALPRLDVLQEAQAWSLPSQPSLESTHRRRSPRLCVEATHVSSQVLKSPRLGVEVTGPAQAKSSPRIGVEFYA